MLDDIIPNSTSTTISVATDPVQVHQEMPKEPPPPAGNSEKAEKYLKQLINLINQDKLIVIHTDLNKFNIETIQDHYRMDLGDYDVEINHSKQPDTGQDIYIMLFNNIKKIQSQEQNCINKAILAYVHLTQNQFENFREAVNNATRRRWKKEETQRFSTVMAPIDNLLDNLNSNAPAPEPAPEEEDENIDLAEYAEESNDEPKASDYLTQS